MIHSTSSTRRGYTLLEILIAVTLMMMIMLGVSQLFSSVGTQINNTQATLQMAGTIRGVKARLDNDLALITADLTKTPPMETGTNKGYFCIIEGMGAAHSNALLQSRDCENPSRSISTQDIAHTSDSSDLNYDNTVGDMDDVLMFTAYAPDGQPFRGLVGGVPYYSNTAEIIWFCRGNTLYRRILLVMPDLEFQQAFNNRAQTAQTEAESRGIGFYANNDVSARINAITGRVSANSLEDLSLRQNRFGHAVGVVWDATNANNWNDVKIDRPNTTAKFNKSFPFNIHVNSANYHLRLPTLLETASYKWDMSQSIEWNFAHCARDWQSGNAPPYKEAVYTRWDHDKVNPVLEYMDYYDDLGAADDETSATLPKDGVKPFIDYWEHPFPWRSLTNVDSPAADVDPLLGLLQPLKAKANSGDKERYTEDVMLTDVLSFDVQVWDDFAKRYVSLGEAQLANGGWWYGYNSESQTEAGPLGRQGNYPLMLYNANGVKQTTRNPVGLPCVYDTWSEEYEREGFSWPDRFVNRDSYGYPAAANDTNNKYVATTGRNLIDDDGNGVIDDLNEWTTPPPYAVPLRGIKVTIRAFDPLSKNVREMTIVRDFVGH